MRKIIFLKAFLVHFFMAENNNTSLEALQGDSKDEDGRGKDRILSPEPERQKLLTEILHAFGQKKLSFATVAGLNTKDLKRVCQTGFTKLRHGRYQEAKEIFEVLSFVDSKNFLHHLALAGAYQKLDSFLDALFQYSEVLEIDSKNTNALVNRGEIFLRKKAYKKAAQDFKEAMLADPKGKDRFANRARSLVIAIKRSLQADIEKGNLSKNKKLPVKKKISPFALLGKKTGSN